MSENDPSGVPSWRVPQESQPDTDAYHIWTSRPLLRSVYWKPVPAPPHDLVSSSYEVFVDQRAWLAMHKHVWQTSSTKVPFGYLVGDLCEDPTANRRFVIVTGAVPARFEFDETAEDQISREAGLALRLEVDRRRGVLVGWYHRHLDGAAELSEQDMRTHTARFTDPWHCAFLFVGDGSSSKGGCFRATPAGVSAELPFPFYEMVSNESLLPRGLKRSYLDWANYETVDEVRMEPPERPDLVVQVPEPIVDAEVEEDLEVEEQPEVEEHPEVEEQPEVEDEPEVEEDLEVEEQPEVEEHPEVEEQPEVEDEPEIEVPPLVEEELGIDWDLDVLREDVDLPETAPKETSSPGIVEMDLVDPDEPDDEIDESADEVSDPEPELVVDEGVEPAIRSVAGMDDYEAPVAEQPLPIHEPMATSKVFEAASREFEAGPPVRTPSRRIGSLVVGFEGESQRGRRVAALGIGGLVVTAAVLIGVLSFTNESGVDLAAGRDASSDGTSASELPIASPGGTPEDSVGSTPVTREQLEQQSQEMLATISRFYGLVVAMDDGTATCNDLQAAFVSVEDAWIEYNSRYKAGYPGRLPEDLAARDERLYLGVQDVEREFQRSGCPRP